MNNTVEYIIEIQIFVGMMYLVILCFILNILVKMLTLF